MQLNLDNYEWFADGDVAANCVVNLVFSARVTRNGMDDVQLDSVDVVEVNEIGDQKLTPAEIAQLPQQFRDEYDRSGNWQETLWEKIAEQAIDRHLERLQFAATV